MTKQSPRFCPALVYALIEAEINNSPGVRATPPWVTR